MTWAHIHLATVHLPVIAMPLFFILLMMAILLKKFELQKAALIGIAFVGIATLPIYLTGEETEEQVEHLANVSERQIEEHEEFAGFGLAAVLLAGTISIATLAAARLKKAWEVNLVKATLIITLVASILLGITANLGGKVRHASEINGTQSTSLSRSAANHDSDDD